MEKVPNREQPITPAEAMGEIALIEQQIRMGPADAEPDVLQSIRQQLEQGTITPDEAVIRARALESERSSHYR